MSLNAKINRSLTISRKPRKQRINKKADFYNNQGSNFNSNGIVKKEMCQNLSSKEKSKDQTLAHQVITKTANKAELSMILEQSETNASNGASGNILLRYYLIFYS